jgi:hypothetical protein
MLSGAITAGFWDARNRATDRHTALPYRGERRALRRELQRFAEDYRAGVKARIAEPRKGRSR